MRIGDWSSDVCSSDLGIEPHDVKRLGLSADLDPAPLPDRIMDEPLLRAEQAAVDMDDIAPIIGFGAQLLHQRRIIAVGDDAAGLAVGLARNAEPPIEHDLPPPAFLNSPPNQKGR